MKKNAAFWILLLVAALNGTGQVRFRTGMQTGLSISTQTIDRLGGVRPLKIDPVASFHVRTTLDVPLTSFFSVQSGFSLEKKGAKVYRPVVDATTASIAQTNLTYIEIPLNARVNLPFSTWSLFAGGGPYIATGISGSEQTQAYTNNHIFQPQMGANGYAVSEYGINVLAGTHIRNVQFTLQYGMGLSNSAPRAYSDIPGVSPPFQNTIKNRVISFGFGYVLEHRRKKVDKSSFISR